MPDDNSPFDPIIRRKAILQDLSIDKSTLSDWVARGAFPKPLVLNPGQAREITGWRASTYVAWKESLPQRAAKPISPNSYSPEARAKGQRTRAAREAPAAVVTEPTPSAPRRFKRPRS